MIHSLTPRFLYMPADGSVDRPILGAVLGNERMLYIDAGNSKRHTAAFREGVRAAAGATRDAVTALTHWHWDHSFGASVDAVPLLSHARTRDKLATQVGLDWSDAAIDERVSAGTEIEFCATYMKKEFGDDRDDIEVRLPDATFEGSMTLHLGGVSCRIDRVGGVHADDSCLFYVPEEKILFIGDALGPAIYDGPRYYKADDLLRLVDLVRAYDAEWYIESHYKPVDRATFWAEMKEFETLAKLALAHGEDEGRIARELAEALGRELTESDRQTVSQFSLGARRS
ncbi:MBL fold metallo-hydrolase [Paenibacillus antri]|uniref:MBL fold metallo-hydrolase n=1 Tax=Paenibacillus antri TaxID=2582848 RepID=A0A5R9G5B9_9BACL|nr:MBL fold metallo-hydrolase [Paenibacillus antri]TLS49330.1 MBL fold metallo-hydrolase [Paenibacillus antri]